MNTEQLNLPEDTLTPLRRNSSSLYRKSFPEFDLKTENEINIDYKKKHLVFFDFDQTIIEGESFFEMIKLLPDWGEPETKKLFEKKGNWFLFVEEIMQILIDHKISAAQIKEQFKKLRLTENFADLLKFLFENCEKFETHIISGTYDIFISWILEHHGIEHTINGIHSEKAVVEDEFVRFIKPAEYIKCSICHFCVCKAKTIKAIIKDSKVTYERWHYIGDGYNDICPALMLNDQDFLYPRKNYQLYRKIFEENYKNKISSRIIIWENGNCILNNLKELFKESKEMHVKETN